jgi:hypothetical protein
LTTIKITVFWANKLVATWEASRINVEGIFLPE